MLAANDNSSKHNCADVQIRFVSFGCAIECQNRKLSNAGCMKPHFVVFCRLVYNNPNYSVANRGHISLLTGEHEEAIGFFECKYPGFCCYNSFAVLKQTCPQSNICRYSRDGVRQVITGQYYAFGETTAATTIGFHCNFSLKLQRLA